MEPVTHFLTGACIGRAGLNRKTAYATLVAVLASEAADADVLWAFGGPVEELKHHRGITHTLASLARGAEKIQCRCTRPKRKSAHGAAGSLGLALRNGADLHAQPSAA
jgi:membrane-bound metal-dependent hydrolase YbcI (DUF457 family)